MTCALVDMLIANLSSYSDDVLLIAARFEDKTLGFSGCVLLMPDLTGRETLLMRLEQYA